MLISIDTNKWATMWQYTKQKGITRQVLNNWISRGKIKTKYIEELDLTLILINSETVKNKETNGNNVEEVPNVTSSQTEISDEEIEKAVKDPMNDAYDFREGAKWYREQLKKK